MHLLPHRPAGDDALASAIHPAKPRRIEEQLRAACRLRQYSIRTEDAYWRWTKQFILFHAKRHPRELGAAEIREFLTALVVARNVAASTQMQALNALVF